MSGEQNKAILRRAYELLSRGNLESLGEVVAQNYVMRNAPMPGLEGLEGLKALYRGFRTSFSDFQITVEDMVAEGDKVVARVTMSGTHTGAFMGIPPTGKSVAISGIDIMRYVEGKAVERWGNYDDIGLLRQLGVIQS
jgi:steroid delta-isomerase-like uncharacterized protein